MATTQAAVKKDPLERTRLLIVLDSLQMGGGERHAVDLAVALHQKGYDVTVACSTNGVLSWELKEAGIPVHYLMRHLVKRRFSPLYAFGLRKLINDEGFDLIHAHIFASVIAASCAALGTGIPLVITEHSQATWRGRVSRFMSRWSYARAAGIIAVSKPLKQRLIQEDGVSGELITVIPNAVTPASRTAWVDAARESHLPSSLLPNQLNGCPVLGVVARLQREKGVGYLLEAVPRILRVVPDCHFLIAGDGPLRNQLQKRARVLGLSSRVHFLGFQPAARDLIQKMNALVVPSLSEGTPLVVLEAMEAGIPIVATKVGGIPEQIRHGLEGLLVPPADPASLAEACLELLQDPLCAHRMGQKARLREEAEFSHATMVSRIESIYSGLLKRPVTSHANSEDLRLRST
jgi:glycosyltransferase involved in cell wall biosynthesis